MAITDAIGQVTTLSYELPADPLKITRVTDPFGRYASFEYDAAGRLSRITDVDRDSVLVRVRGRRLRQVADDTRTERRPSGRPRPGRLTMAGGDATLSAAPSGSSTVNDVRDALAGADLHGLPCTASGQRVPDGLLLQRLRVRLVVLLVSQHLLLVEASARARAWQTTPPRS